MADEKLILIGCDGTDTLSAVMNGLRHSVVPHTVISALRASDLIRVAQSMQPDLIILCFRNNQHALNDLDIFLRQPEIPVVCLARRSECDELCWSSNSIVFCYPLEQIGNKEYLSSRINSIFLLRNNGPLTTAARSLAEAAMPNNSENLSRYVMELDQKVEVLMKVKERIAHLYPRVDDPIRAELTSIVNSIKLASNDQKLWEDFKLYFERMNPNFLLTLVKKHPGLTPKDLKYCCYMKMNMENDDIRTLLGINQESVRTHKYRLKKKLVLRKDQDLRSYLRSVG